ncbi:MAG: hypothetical protein R3E95_17495 [Thiolinea sp.]
MQLIGFMLPQYHDPVDIVLTIIMVISLLAIMAVAVYTAWHFWQRSRSFGRLMAWLSIGVLGIPLVSAAGALFSYVNLTA